MSTTTWKLDPAHTDITFSAKHMMITTVRGTFGDVDGTLEIDEAAPTAARGTIRVRVASLSTGFAARDTHLRSADFFDVERFPEIVVAFDGVEALGGDRWRVPAELTIRDVTRPLTFEVEHVGETTNFQGTRHIAFTAKATLNREDWGLNWNMALETGGWLVGKDIKLVVEVVADEVVAAADGEREPVSAAA
ncbi:MAG TPA: YceI family protein [Candidatus Limnocylindrales bacterium]|nr:YceI family protein [Candidatus Limnocylindrales bacterium]